MFTKKLLNIHLEMMELNKKEVTIQLLSIIHQYEEIIFLHSW